MQAEADEHISNMGGFAQQTSPAAQRRNVPHLGPMAPASIPVASPPASTEPELLPLAAPLLLPLAAPLPAPLVAPLALPLPASPLSPLLASPRFPLLASPRSPLLAPLLPPLAAPLELPLAPPLLLPLPLAPLLAPLPVPLLVPTLVGESPPQASIVAIAVPRDTTRRMRLFLMKSLQARLSSSRAPRTAPRHWRNSQRVPLQGTPLQQSALVAQSCP
jgi:hypothetical protein